MNTKCQAKKNSFIAYIIYLVICSHSFDVVVFGREKFGDFFANHNVFISKIFGNFVGVIKKNESHHGSFLLVFGSFGVQFGNFIGEILDVFRRKILDQIFDLIFDRVR